MPQAGVQIGKGLVEQQALGPDHQRAGERYPLLLAARKLIDAPAEVRFHAYRLERVPHSLLGLAPRDPALLQTKGDVFGHREMRPQGEALKHHARIAQVGRDPRDLFVSEQNPSGVGHREPGDAAEQRGLARAAGTEEQKELSRLHPKVDRVENERVIQTNHQILYGDGHHRSQRKAKPKRSSNTRISADRARQSWARLPMISGPRRRPMGLSRPMAHGKGTCRM